MTALWLGQAFNLPQPAQASSLLAQRKHRVDRGGAACGEIRRGNGRDGKRDERSRDGYGILRAQPEEQ
jgi:hypothetical protein